MSSPPSREEEGPLQDEVDPTYTHFAHRDEFMERLGRFLAIDTATNPTTEVDRTEQALVTELGTIVGPYDGDTFLITA